MAHRRGSGRVPRTPPRPDQAGRIIVVMAGLGSRPGTSQHHQHSQRRYRSRTARPHFFLPPKRTRNVRTGRGLLRVTQHIFELHRSGQSASSGGPESQRGRRTFAPRSASTSICSKNHVRRFPIGESSANRPVRVTLLICNCQFRVIKADHLNPRNTVGNRHSYSPSAIA